MWHYPLGVGHVLGSDGAGKIKVLIFAIRVSYKQGSSYHCCKIFEFAEERAKERRRKEESSYSSPQVGPPSSQSSLPTCLRQSLSVRASQDLFFLPLSCLRRKASLLHFLVLLCSSGLLPLLKYIDRRGQEPFINNAFQFQGAQDSPSVEMDFKSSERMELNPLQMSPLWAVCPGSRGVVSRGLTVEVPAITEAKSLHCMISMSF